jgi:hypothetical protein
MFYIRHLNGWDQGTKNKVLWCDFVIILLLFGLLETRKLITSCVIAGLLSLRKILF